MKQSTIVWTILMILGGGFLVFRATTHGMGEAYVRAVEVTPADPNVKGWTKYVSVDPKEKNRKLIEKETKKEKVKLTDGSVSLSWPRTIGIWFAAFFTLCILSFLWGDNVFYKLAEALVIGASAAYAMVVGFWTGIVQNLFGRLSPELIKVTVMPGLEKEQNLLYLFALVLSVMMLMRLSPAGGWISRWPLAFFIGATAGIRLLVYLDADFIQQIRSTIIPLVVVAADGSVSYWASLKNFTIVIGVMACLVYFFFSIEHKGVVGGISRLGIWVLMITFGAGFGYTVMGRIALISDRFEFLFVDWLWLIDPAGKRLGM